MAGQRAASTASVVISGGGIELEGVLHLPAEQLGPGVVVCHPHPLYGGDMRSNVVLTICEVAAGLGITALRFNFRGVGASQGSFGNGVGERADAVAAVDHLRRVSGVDETRLAIAGYSFGAAVALLAAPADMKAVVAVSTPTIAHGLESLKIACPALLVVGDRDQVAPPGRLEGLRPHVPAAEVVTVPGVDHFWVGGEQRLAEPVRAFLAQHLGPPPAP